MDSPMQLADPPRPQKNMGLPDPPPTWVRGPLVGAGAFGSVYRCLSLTTGAILAAKSSSAAPQSQQMQALEREICALRQLEPSLNVISYLGDDWTREGGVPTRNLLMELAPGGSIPSLLKTFAPRGFPEGLVRWYTHSILLGLAHIHRNGLAHLDIKGGNVLVAESGDVKICDFGACRFVGRDGEGGGGSEAGARAAELRGTLCWMAPEVTQGQWGDTRSDIWSLGCTVLEMATGRPPWQSEGQDNDWRAVMAKIACTQELPACPLGMSDCGKDFVSRCLERDPRDRWTAEELMRHPFLSEPQQPQDQHQHLASQGGCTRGSSPVSILSPLRSSDPSAADDLSLNAAWAQPLVRGALPLLHPDSSTPSLGSSVAAPSGVPGAATHLAAPAAQLVVAVLGDERGIPRFLDAREDASGAATSEDCDADCDGGMEGYRSSALDSPLFAMCSGPPSPLLLSPLSDVAAAIGCAEGPAKPGHGRDHHPLDWQQDSLMLWPVSPPPQHYGCDQDSVCSIPIATPVDPTLGRRALRVTRHTGALPGLWESEFWPSRPCLGDSAKLERSWL